MINTKSFIPIVCSCLLLGGCVQTEIIEKVQIVEGIGFDYAEDEKYNISHSALVFEPNEQGSQIKTETFSSTNFTTFGSVNTVRREMPRPATGGKMLVAIFGEDLAKKGIGKVIEGLSQFPSIGRMVMFCVVEGNAKEFLDGQYSMNQTVSRYVKDLLRQNENENLPATNFHEFMYSYYSIGHDPFMPIIKKQENNIILTGLALFESDKYVDKISPDQLFPFKMLYEGLDAGTYEATFHENNTHLSLETVQSKVDYNIKDGMSNPKIEITIKIKAFVNELISNVELATEDDEEYLEKLLENELKEKSLLLINQFKKKKIDPLGIADRARSQTRGWKTAKWQELYPEATFTININVDILETGITTGTT